MGFRNMTLVKIAAVTGIATVAMGYAARMKISNNICQTEYYKEALKTVRSHKGAVNLLGEPIKDRQVDVGNEEQNYTKNLSAHYEVPVKGAKERGTVHFWAERKSQDDKWLVTRIELGLKNDPSRRLLIKSEEKQSH